MAIMQFGGHDETCTSHISFHILIYPPQTSLAATELPDGGAGSQQSSQMAAQVPHAHAVPEGDCRRFP